MKWRTDKPTADLIVAHIKYPSISEYDILTRTSSGEYCDNYDVIPFHYIEKWADLEEDDNGIYITYKDISNLEEIMNYVHYEFRNGIGKDSFGKEVIEQFKNGYLEEDETVKDCDEYSAVEEELDTFIKSGKAIKEENCGTYTTTYIDPLKVARHFAKWGAEHLKK